jgi:hypothetical protein
MSLPGIIPTISGADALGDETTISTNHWGFSIQNSPLGDQTKWLSMPNSSNPLTVKSTSVPNEDGDDTVFTYGAKINTQQLAGRYQTTILYTAIGNE